VIIPTINLNRSVGVVGLDSTDPRDPPRIELNYLSSDVDVARLREGIRLGLRLAGQMTVLNTPFGRHFYAKDEQFTKTGSGQT
jgi:choline dehydrogenase-like flavoprotein